MGNILRCKNVTGETIRGATRQLGGPPPSLESGGSRKTRGAKNPSKRKVRQNSQDPQATSTRGVFPGSFNCLRSRCAGKRYVSSVMVDGDMGMPSGAGCVISSRFSPVAAFLRLVVVVMVVVVVWWG